MIGQLIDGLKDEIEELRRQYPAFKNEDLFLLWFLRAYVTDDLESGAKAITNGPKDKGIDAIFVDDSARCVFVVQSKYRQEETGKLEPRQDVLSFAHLSQVLRGKDDKALRDLIDGANPSLEGKLLEAHRRLNRTGYRLWLYYVTLGKCSTSLRNESENIVRRSGDASYMEILDGRRLKLLWRDYLDGVAPPIPTLDLVMESGHGITVNGILQRYDAHSRIESWVFSMKGDAIVELFEAGGKRLFARNIRGFLGDTDVNRSMEHTLKTEPARFFYYNNGITILCDEAKKVSSQGRDVLRVSNPQVINGQQTTRTLARKAMAARKASVICRVIRVPRGGSDGDDEFDSLVSQIVEATNWQNAIKSSDLVANDRRQIELQRELRKRGYLYLRKRESKGEAQRTVGCRCYIPIKKEDLARAVAGCDLDPVEARSGVENLFDDDKYSIIFPTADSRYYLTRYWALRKVTYIATGYPQRGYAKWLVLGFLWTRLSDLMRTRHDQEKFIRLIEQGNQQVEHPLLHAIEDIFKAALVYWQKNKGKGAKAQDPSTFFRNKRGRHKEFLSFWRGSNNKYRGSFAKAWKKFGQGFAKECSS
jgi:hypothetical protein